MRFLFLIFLISPLAQAYYSVLDTGEILQPGHYDMSLEGEFVTNNGRGANLVGRFDAPLSEETQVRAMVGFGTTDFHFGALFKWIPVPDLKRQPAIGLIAGGIFARITDDRSSNTYLTFRLAPLISKTIAISGGELTPFASLPLGIRTGASRVDGPVQFAVGTEYKTNHLENFKFRGELGFDLNNKSYSYVSLNAILLFDEEHGIVFK